MAGHRRGGLNRPAGGFAALAALLSLAASPACAQPASLLSLGGIVLKPNEYVSEFDVRTWGLTILAVCRIPRGWRITAGTDGSFGGSLAGQAGVGAAALGQRDLGRLQGMFLVRGPIGGRHDRPQGDRPATFAGTVTIGTYGVDAPGRRGDLDASRITLAPAARCPAPE